MYMSKDFVTINRNILIEDMELHLRAMALAFYQANTLEN